MGFLFAQQTDIGIKKSINQDSLYVAEANTPAGAVLLAVVCDGMGGLSKGELASAEVCRAFSRWFKEELPNLLSSSNQSAPINIAGIESSLANLLKNCNDAILDYSVRHHLTVGTTALALLLTTTSYYIVNIGDSRVYQIDTALYQLTKDQSVVQQEVDLGILSQEQAEMDSRRNILLQCMGAKPTIEPQFIYGTYLPDTVFLLCTDGFRHVITPKELYESLCPQKMLSEAQMHDNLKALVELNKSRNETDNITAIAIRQVP
ncbi:MAG: serine/threonine-protein phosphatase [Coriobacteriales bacterium]|jgi:serine/threonine protein phosphatase PrpC|nr:serine/threonine-protein phosphatase [Coriobacteriales bacterium]